MTNFDQVCLNNGLSPSNVSLRCESQRVWRVESSQYPVHAIGSSPDDACFNLSQGINHYKKYILKK